MNNLPKKALAAILILISLVAVGAAALAIPVGILHTWNVTTVNNADMSPDIPRGSFVISERVSTESINNGDVVALNSRTGSNSASISRVISKTASEDAKSYYYQVQGDNNDLPDDWSYQVSDTTYKVFATIPLLGYLILPINNIAGAIIFAVAIIAIVIFFVKKFYKAKEQTLDEEEKERLAAEARAEQDSVAEVRGMFDEIGSVETTQSRRERRRLAQEKAEAEALAEQDKEKGSDKSVQKVDINE